MHADSATYSALQTAYNDKVSHLVRQQVREIHCKELQKLVLNHLRYIEIMGPTGGQFGALYCIVFYGMVCLPLYAWNDSRTHLGARGYPGY